MKHIIKFYYVTVKVRSILQKSNRIRCMLDVNSRGRPKLKQWLLVKILGFAFTLGQNLGVLKFISSIYFR